MMFKVMISLVAMTLLAACATRQIQIDPAVGEWKYVIENLPRGEPEGVFIISKEGESYTGTLQQNGQEAVPINDIAMGDAVLESSRFQAQGNTVNMSGAFDGDSFVGKLSVRNFEFPITAVRQK